VSQANFRIAPLARPDLVERHPAEELAADTILPAWRSGFFHLVGLGTHDRVAGQRARRQRQNNDPSLIEPIVLP
jgi:hypothetical protein